MPPRKKPSKAVQIKKYKAILRKQADVMRKMKQYRDENKIEFFDKKPNPGPNPRQHEILENWLDPYYEVFTLTGGNRLGKCVTYQTLIDTPGGEVPIGFLYDNKKPFYTYAFNGEKKVVAQASVPIKKSGIHKCFKIEMSDGRWVEAADYHRILTSAGWLSVSDIHSKFSVGLLLTNSEYDLLIHGLNVGRSSQTQSGFPDYCFESPHRCDGRPLFFRDISQVSLPSPSDVLAHIPSLFYGDGLASRYTNTPCQDNDHLSILDGRSQNEDPSSDSECHNAGKTLSSSSVEFQLSQKPHCELISDSQLNPLIVQHRLLSSLSSNPPICVIGNNRIESIKLIPTCQEVYDFEVKEYHNYFAGGMVHHNTVLGTLLAFSTLFGKYMWDGRSLLHLFNHNQPRKVRYVGQDWEKHIKAVLMPELEKWWPKNRQVKKKKNNNGVDANWIDIETGSTLEIMSNKQESDLHEGWSGDLIIYDEPPKRNIRVANARGLVDRLGREFFGMTLLKEAWIDREVLKATDDAGKPDMKVFNVHGESYDNVGYGITKEGLNRFASKLTEEERESRLKGIPSYMAGLVYPGFSRKMHLRERFKIPLDWMIDIAIDVHPRERQAVLFIATSPRNERYLVEEIWGHGDGTWIGENIARAVNFHSYRVNRIIVDPLAKGDKNNDDSVYEKIAKVLMSRGYVLETASKDKTHGILEIKNHLIGPNNQPSMFFFNDLVRTIFEIEGYMWDKDTQKPMDKDDHMMENLYRLLLLDTQYEDEDAFDEYNYPDTYSGRDAITGY